MLRVAYFLTSLKVLFVFPKQVVFEETKVEVEVKI